jgi:hypothetical protein
MIQEVFMKKKLSGLRPDNKWSNKKGHLSALVKGGKVIAYSECSLAGNSYYSNIRGRSCHSEIGLLTAGKLNIKNKRQISKYTIWNIRWDKNGEIKNSKPCLNCQQILLNIGIKKIVFSTDGGIFKKNKLSELLCVKSSGYRY